MPRYTHDCDSCKFLGEHREYDLYYCARCDEGTVIARYSSDGPGYASIPVALLTEEVQASYNKGPHYAAGQALVRALELRNKEAECSP